MSRTLHPHDVLLRSHGRRTFMWLVKSDRLRTPGFYEEVQNAVCMASGILPHVALSIDDPS